MFATPRTPTNTRSDELGKDDIVDQLAVFELVAYNPDTDTKYGVTATIDAIVTVVDGEHAGRVENRFFAAGNLARQIGEALDEGQMAPGRVIRGTSANGRNWYGINWATDAGDLQRAADTINPPKPRPNLAQETREAGRTVRAAARQQHTAATNPDAPF